MNTTNETNDIPNEELTAFKYNVKNWLELDLQILELQKRARELRKKRDKELEPKITIFMRTYNISDLNTTNGKIRCTERNTKKGLNKNNIRDNLSQILNDNSMVDIAMERILNNREINTSYKLKLVKPKN